MGLLCLLNCIERESITVTKTLFNIMFDKRPDEKYALINGIPIVISKRHH